MASREREPRTFRRGHERECVSARAARRYPEPEPREPPGPPEIRGKRGRHSEIQRREEQQRSGLEHDDTRGLIHWALVMIGRARYPVENDEGGRVVFKDGPLDLLASSEPLDSVAPLGDANRGMCPWPCTPR